MSLVAHKRCKAEPQAVATMRRALDEFVVKGIPTTIPLHRRIFRDSAFVEGGIDTKYLERTYMKTEG